ncbi:hypothetical protein L7F22_011667 [Adiantum nelumboides]|nr:hypothetical protein [Adiantum nelumboides]
MKGRWPTSGASSTFNSRLGAGFYLVAFNVKTTTDALLGAAVDVLLHAAQVGRRLHHGVSVVVVVAVVVAHHQHITLWSAAGCTGTVHVGQVVGSSVA